MKYLIAGLGNIGPEYANTRHNIGFMVLDELAQKEGVKFSFEKLAYTAEFKHKGRTIHLIKPTTYMNLSGKAVNYWMQVHKVPVENLLVIVDDLALPFGKLRLRGQGSAAGHNGLKDIEQVLTHNNYARLRFGIGSNFPKGRQADYVLGEFDKDEFAGIKIPIEKACEMVLGFCSVGLPMTMSKYND